MLSSVLLSVLGYYHPDTELHIQGTIYEPLVVHCPSECFSSPWQWHAHLAKVVVLCHIFAQTITDPPSCFTLGTEQVRWTQQKTVHFTLSTLLAPLKLKFGIAMSDQRFGYCSLTLNDPVGLEQFLVGSVKSWCTFSYAVSWAAVFFFYFCIQSWLLPRYPYQTASSCTNGYFHWMWFVILGGMLRIPWNHGHLLSWSQMHQFDT